MNTTLLTILIISLSIFAFYYAVYKIKSAQTQEVETKLDIKSCLTKTEPASPGVVKTSKRQSKASFINIVDQKANLNQTSKNIGEIDITVPPLSTAV